MSSKEKRNGSDLSGLPNNTVSKPRFLRRFLWRRNGQGIELQRALETVARLETLLSDKDDRIAKIEAERDGANALSHQLTTNLEIQQLDATTDDLTGAHNRKAFNTMLEGVEKMVADKGYTGKGCVVALDLDRFKLVNDTYGHAAGDEVLKAVVRRLQSLQLISAETKLYRLGGDEFVIVVLDKRHDIDRRSEHSDQAKRENPDRRQTPFENYVRSSIREAIIEAANNGVLVPVSDGEFAEVDFGISEGFGFFDETNIDAILTALRDADTEAYVRKSGLDDFLACYEQMDDETQKFVDEVLGLVFDEEARGGFTINREIGFAAFSQMEEFQSFMNNINLRSFRWMFPDYSPSAPQNTQALER